MNPQQLPPLGDALRDALPVYEAPASLRAWARAHASAGVGDNSRAIVSHRMRRFAYAASIILAVAAGWMGQRLAAGTRGDDTKHRELVAALVDTHVRSLMANHLVDIPSSEQHTVKPWFAGKVNFAPRVPDLAAQGFPLKGGRVEYVAGHTAAALVYGRRLHTINLLIWPMSPSDNDASLAAFNGYSLAHWSDHGLNYWAVSDAAASELRAFELAYTSGH